MWFGRPFHFRTIRVQNYVNGALVLKPATLDDITWLRPEYIIWVKSARDWVPVPERVKVLQEQTKLGLRRDHRIRTRSRRLVQGNEPSNSTRWMILASGFSQEFIANHYTHCAALAVASRGVAPPGGATRCEPFQSSARIRAPFFAHQRGVVSRHDLTKEPLSGERP